MTSGTITSWQIERGKVETVKDFIFFGSKITAEGDCSHEIKRHLLLGRKVMTNLDSILKSRDITLLTKVCIVKAMVFFAVMYRCKSWTIKKAQCQRTDPAPQCNSPLDCKEIKPVNPKGNQPWIIIRRNDAEDEALILWPLEAKSWLTGKDLDAWEDWGQEEKGATEDKVLGWWWNHHLSGHEFEQTQGDNEGQGSLACCSTWGCK